MRRSRMYYEDRNNDDYEPSNPRAGVFFIGAVIVIILAIIKLLEWIYNSI